jgi:antitoxin (DNA-binding transcriptional repressor) of toxin-antitoxin stability system
MMTMTTEEFERDPNAVLREINSGKAVVVTNNGDFIAQVVPMTTRKPMPRPVGLAAGDFIVPDDFDEPLDESIIRDFGNL